jgi:predicted RNA-binding Zn-ribbon protein involved in translation (DUF1610 family)
MGILQDMREIFGTLSHKRPSKIYCPRCASPQIHLSGSLTFGLLPGKYVCEKCGYNGPLVMELEKEEE